MRLQVILRSAQTGGLLDLDAAAGGLQFEAVVPHLQRVAGIV